MTSVQRSERESTGKALEILLRRHQNGVPRLALFWLCVALFLGSLYWARQDAQVLFCVQFVLMGVLPLCASWDSRLLHRVRQHRFLDMTILTGMTPRDWSDGLVRRALSVLWSGSWKLLVGVLLLTAWWAPGVLPQALLWLATLALLTVTLSYGHQLTAAFSFDPSGKEVRAFLALPQVATVLWFEVSEWASWNVHRELFDVAATLGLLLLARAAVCWRLERMLQGQGQARTFLSRAMRPWSRNPIVMRESWRSGRRGGLPAVIGRRYLAFLIFTGLVAWTVFDVGVGRGPWFIYYNEAAGNLVGWLGLYAVAACPMVYWSTLSAQQTERNQEATLLTWTTPLRAEEYLNGWIDFATRYRYLEVASIYSVGLIGMGGCWWAALGWSRWLKMDSEFLPVTFALVVGMGLVTVVLVRCIACLALRESAIQSTRLAKQVALFGWLLPYLGVCAVAWALSFNLGRLVGLLPAAILSCATVYLITLWFYRRTYSTALVHIRSMFWEDGVAPHVGWDKAPA